jgi:hypothetical protein
MFLQSLKNGANWDIQSSLTSSFVILLLLTMRYKKLMGARLDRPLMAQCSHQRARDKHVLIRVQTARLFHKPISFLYVRNFRQIIFFFLLWGCAKPSNTKIIQRVQSEILRIVFNLYPTNVENWASSWQYSNILVYPTRCNITQLIHIWKLLYMFRVVLPLIIRSAYNYIYIIYHNILYRIISYHNIYHIITYISYHITSYPIIS